MEIKRELVLSALAHTWILDLDGTIVKHNGYKIDGWDTFLEGAKEFLERIPEEDMIIFLTSRTEEQKQLTEEFLDRNHVRYQHIIYGVPYGERILMNDRKPSGLETALSVSLKRDCFDPLEIRIDSEI